MRNAVMKKTFERSVKSMYRLMYYGKPIGPELEQKEAKKIMKNCAYSIKGLQMERIV